MEPAIIEKIRVRLSEGATIKAISQELKISYWQAYYAVKTHNLPVPQVMGRALPEETARQIRKLIICTDLSPIQIRKKLGLRSTMPIYRQIQRQNQMWELYDRAEDRATNESTDLVTTKLAEPERCPVHGRVTVWPCVACAALNRAVNK